MSRRQAIETGHARRATRTIQELAVRTVIQTTMRYLHLADSARSSAIKLLDG